MVLFEFVNSCLSTYGPYYIIHSGLRLGRTGMSKVFYFIILLHYAITQFVKLFILALITRWMTPPSGTIAVMIEESVNVGDLIGIYVLLMQRHAVSVENKARILLVGLWWGFYDSIATNCLPYLMNATSKNFTLVHIYRAASANSFLFANMSKVCLIYLWSKYRKSGLTMLPIMIFICYFIFILPVMDKTLMLVRLLDIPQWAYLIGQFVFTMMLAFLSKVLADMYAIRLKKLVEEDKGHEKE